MQKVPLQKRLKNTGLGTHPPVSSLGQFEKLTFFSCFDFGPVSTSLERIPIQNKETVSFESISYKTRIVDDDIK